MSALVETITP
ncbi:Putative asd leader peptide [Deinococcus deserti]|uniref:Putative asd leader peptide n=1 Tax=Deinococcus deserti (strain DSM 17065 / CIP 109153 / LMG 22923 / VCD115) TaxID=546414 RepID=X5H5R1_DEIDV|nr:putative asd leader peptide [Deinococcus deserti VCD115]